MKKKYLHEGEKPEDFIPRVCSIFSDEVKPKAEKVLNNADFLPAGRTLTGAGYKGTRKVSMSNCYILPNPEDNIESIFDTAKKIARISSYGGGTGLCIDNLRPKGSKVNNSAITSTGSVSFLPLFNTTGEIIGQHGRRAALMVALRCDHPDIEEFLQIKKNNVKLSSMNISIKFTDDFMRAVINNENVKLHFDSKQTGYIEKIINARDFFDDFCKTQWDMGDPGALFIDRINSYNLLDGYPEYHIDVTNPCSEIAANAYNSCNLGSINIYNMIDNKFTNEAKVNFDKLIETAKSAVDMLDEVLDYGRDMQPLEENKTCIDQWRYIGLGVFGLADAFVALRLRYGSANAIKVTKQIMGTILNAALEESSYLATKKGTFGMYDKAKTNQSKFLKNVEKELKAVGIEPTGVYAAYNNGLRNGGLLSVAPTGTISLFAGTFTGGVEPMFKIAYRRTTHSTEDDKKTFLVYSRGVHDLLVHHNIDPLKIDIDEIKEKFPFVVDTYDVDPMNRVGIQAAMQTFVDNAISSTVNLPHSATVEDIYKIYIKAWESHLKGITIFRDGCARGNILGVDFSNKKVVTPSYNSIIPAKRRGVARVDGSTYKQSSSCAKSMYVTVNKTKGGDIFEVFTNSSGGCQANVSTITRLVSLALRSGIKVDKIVEELRENKCPACQALRRAGNKDVSLSCANAIADAVQKAIDNTDEVEDVKEEEGFLVCPSCHKRTLRPEGKCFTCSNCGYNACDN